MLYLYPYFISRKTISYAWSSGTNGAINYVKKGNFDELVNLINTNDEDVIGCNLQRLVVNPSVNKKIFDIDLISKLYKRKINDFLLKNKSNNVIKNFNKSNLLKQVKTTAFNKADKGLISNQRLEILPLNLIFPDHILDKIILSNIEYMKFFINEHSIIDDFPYFEIFVNFLNVYQNIEAGTIDKEFINNLKLYHRDNLVVKKITDLSDNLKNDTVPVPVYDLFSSKTGRPYINSGINYQQLPSQLKKVLKSKWENGKLYEIDFNGCEVRTALFCIENTKISNIQSDVYSYFTKIIAEKAKIKLNRKLVKNLLIPMLYGASTKTISNFAKFPEQNIKHLIRILMYEFNLKKIKKDIEKQINKNQYFYNFFGRPIYENDLSKKTRLIQNYIQSTAADICHIGYSNVVNFINKNGLKSYIVYTRHDSILIDVHPDENEYIEKFGVLIGKIDKYNINFLTTTKEV
tara:strand:+ start:11167 stop:12552 length:1386 start_codon:yes stop_codon:yes gene_type:complete